MLNSKEEQLVKWYVMRDLSRPNSKSPAYKVLAEKHFEVFTPMKRIAEIKQGKRVYTEKPFLHDLLFVHSSKELLNEEVEKTDTLQYRFVKGGKYQECMFVSEKEMQKFVSIVTKAENIKYYMPGELTPDKFGKQIRIIGGLFDGYEGCLLKTRGREKRKLVVDIPQLLTAAVEVDNLDFIQFI